MKLDDVVEIMVRLVDQTCSENLRLYRNDKVCVIETTEGESFSACINKFGIITLDSHFTGSNVVNGKENKSKMCFSLSTFETELEYQMMHYFSDYLERLKNAAFWED